MKQAISVSRHFSLTLAAPAAPPLSRVSALSRCSFNLEPSGRTRLSSGPSCYSQPPPIQRPLFVRQTCGQSRINSPNPCDSTCKNKLKSPNQQQPIIKCTFERNAAIRPRPKMESSTQISVFEDHESHYSDYRSGFRGVVTLHLIKPLRNKINHMTSWSNFSC